MNINIILKKKYSNWADLESIIENIQSTKEKGTVFEQFVKLYFTYFKNIYLISKIYMESEIPFEIKQILKLEKRDSGVDGVIVKENGKLIAYQAKFRSRGLAPSYDDLTSFWAESEHADERCIFANSYSLPNQTYKKKNQFMILRNELSSLNSDFFDWLYDFANNRIEDIPVKKFAPMEHQIEIIEQVVSGFTNQDRGKVLAACGTGKTLTALWIKEALEAKTVLFVAPNLALIKQTLEAWMPQSEKPFTYLCVCSDSTVASGFNDDIDDEFITDPSYIGVPVTTDFEKIIDFFNFKTNKDKIIFSTYQSLDSVVSAIQNTEGIEFDIIFFDEAHRTAGNKNSKTFVLGMNNEFIPSKKRLFMTATERFVKPTIITKAKKYNYDIFSMDDKTQYGNTFSSLPFRKAIEDGIISDYKIVVCCLKEKEINQIIEKQQLLKIGEHHTTGETLFKQVLLAKTMSEIGIRKIISYHKNIEFAKNFINSAGNVPLAEVILSVSEMDNSNEIYCDHINGGMTAGDRKKIFDKFIESKFGVISNARCLTEGVDVPVIDAVYFSDPKNSIIDIIQAVGRSLRKVRENPNKISYIILPIIIADDAENFSSINPENFSTLHNVIQALRDQDRILADYIDKLNIILAKGKDPTGNPGDPEPPLVIFTSEEIGISDVAKNILLRIAEVNKDPDDISSEFIFEPKSRTSGVSRGFFTSIGDYNLDSYWNSCVMETLKKYDSHDFGLPRTHITIDNNNVSHAERIGAIVKEPDSKFYVSDLGNMFNECTSFETALPLFKEQLLKYYKLDQETHIPYFPYRYALRILSKVKIISKFEFAYSMFISKNLHEKGVAESVETINYLRNTFPRIETLNEVNKAIVLETLNEKYNTTFKLIDIWSSKTTLNNQYNYLKKHLSIWDNLLDSNSKEIKLQKNGENYIHELLERTNLIEKCPMDQLSILYRSYNNWL